MAVRPELLVEVQLPLGTSIETTSTATKKIEQWLSQQPEAKIVTAYIGAGAPRFFFSYNPELPDPSFAKMVVLTPNAKARDHLNRAFARPPPMASRRKRGFARRNWSLALTRLSPSRFE